MLRGRSRATLILASLLFAMLLLNPAHATSITATPNAITVSNPETMVGGSTVLSTTISQGTPPYTGSWGFMATNTTDGTIVNTIRQGYGSNTPYDIAVNPQNTLVYVTSGSNSYLFVVSQTTNTVINTIKVGGSPFSVSFNPSGTLAYVSNQNDGTVSVIDPSTNTVINTITVGTNPYHLSFNPSGTLVYVPNFGSGTVSIIDTQSNDVINTVTVGSDPYDVAFNPSGTLAYVANFGGPSVSVINPVTNTVINTITVGSSPNHLEFNPSGTLAYVSDGGGGSRDLGHRPHHQRSDQHNIDIR
ncbi:MAG: YncE family protein [Candidatus Micrarchaeota archaeon]|nr:YncE family protein [Candidatus Micrarchaeota archaeon]